MLLYVTAVKLLLIPFCIGLVCGIVHGKVVVAGKVLLGTHIYIIMVGRIEHIVDSCTRRHTYRARRQSLDAIGIVRGRHLEVFAPDSAQREVAHGIFHGRVGLEAYPFLEPVEVKACHHRPFILLGGLLLDDRCHGGHLDLA